MMHYAEDTHTILQLPDRKEAFSSQFPNDFLHLILLCANTQSRTELTEGLMAFLGECSRPIRHDGGWHIKRFTTPFVRKGSAIVFNMLPPQGICSTQVRFSLQRNSFMLVNLIPATPVKIVDNAAWELIYEGTFKS